MTDEAEEFQRVSVDDRQPQLSIPNENKGSLLNSMFFKPFPTSQEKAALSKSKRRQRFRREDNSRGECSQGESSPTKLVVRETKTPAPKKTRNKNRWQTEHQEMLEQLFAMGEPSKLILGQLFPGFNPQLLSRKIGEIRSKKEQTEWLPKHDYVLYKGILRGTTDWRKIQKRFLARKSLEDIHVRVDFLRSNFKGSRSIGVGKCGEIMNTCGTQSTRDRDISLGSTQLTETPMTPRAVSNRPSTPQISLPPLSNPEERIKDFDSFWQDVKNKDSKAKAQQTTEDDSALLENLFLEDKHSHLFDIEDINQLIYQD